MGPAIPANPRYQILWVKKARIFAASAIAAKMGRSVLTKIPSYCAKKPRPNPLANEPRAGKHEVQPMAAVSAPNVPVLSNKFVMMSKGFVAMLIYIFLIDKFNNQSGAIASMWSPLTWVQQGKFEPIYCVGVTIYRFNYIINSVLRYRVNK